MKKVLTATATVFILDISDCEIKIGGGEFFAYFDDDNKLKYYGNQFNRTIYLGDAVRYGNFFILKLGRIVKIDEDFIHLKDFEDNKMYKIDMLNFCLLNK